jgi:hypothetical protein
MASNRSTEPTHAREKLRAALKQEHAFLGRLIQQAGDPAVSSARLVDLVEELENLDLNVEGLIAQLREETSGARRQQQERSIRQFVLAALEGIGVPQGAGFLQEYLWARERVDLDTRGLSALRRDERRSWERNPGRRLAYIVPALSVDGAPVSRLMARSDWSLERRLLIPEDERLFNLRRLQALFSARGEAESEDPSDPFRALIEKYAEAVFAEPAALPDGDGGRAGGLARLRSRVDAESAQADAAVAHQREKAATRLRSLPEAQQFWGTS